MPGGVDGNGTGAVAGIGTGEVAGIGTGAVAGNGTGAVAGSPREAVATVVGKVVDAIKWVAVVYMTLDFLRWLVKYLARVCR